MTTALTQAADGTPLVVSATGAPSADAPGIVVRSAAAAYAQDLLGRAQVSEPKVIFDSTPSYGLDTTIWQALTSGAGNTVAWNANTRAVDLTLAAAGYAGMQTYPHIVYELGRPVRVNLTGNMGAVQANVTREWGQFDAANGVFFRRKPDGSLVFVKRSSTSGTAVDEEYPESVWNGESVPARRLHNNNLFFIEYAWLGAAGVRYGFWRNGVPVFLHTQEYADELPASYMQTATLPIRWMAYAADAPAAPATMSVVCSQIESLGGYEITAALPLSAGRPVGNLIAAGAATVPVVAIRPTLLIPATTGIPNRVRIDVTDLDAYASGGAADFRLIWFPHGLSPLTGGSWVRGATLSGVEANISATAIDLTGGIEIGRFPVSAGGAVRNAAAAVIRSALPLTLDVSGANSPLTSNVGANPSTLVMVAFGAGSSVSGGMRWTEVY
jgi:hypothetical protein